MLGCQNKQKDSKNIFSEMLCLAFVCVFSSKYNLFVLDDNISRWHFYEGVSIRVAYKLTKIIIFHKTVSIKNIWYQIFRKLFSFILFVKSKENQAIDITNNSWLLD